MGRSPGSKSQPLIADEILKPLLKQHFSDIIVDSRVFDNLLVAGIDVVAAHFEGFFATIVPMHVRMNGSQFLRCLRNVILGDRAKMQKFAVAITHAVQRIHEKASQIKDGSRLSAPMQRLTLLSKRSAESHKSQATNTTKRTSSLLKSKSDLVLPTETTSPGKRALAAAEADLSDAQAFWNQTTSTPKKAKVCARQAADDRFKPTRP